MPKSRPYSVIYALQTQEHLRAIEPKNRSLIREQVDETHRLVQVLAIGIKEGNRLIFANAEVQP